MADPAGAVYGHALFDSASEAGRLREVEADLSSFGRALAGSRELAGVLFNPAFPERGKKQILAQLTADADPLIRNAVQVLVDHGRLTSLPDVIAEFEERFRAAQKQLQVA